MSPDRDRPDACPGAVDVFQASDGGLARVRVPGGTIDAERFDVLRLAALELGDGWIELTSRSNLQVRGLAEGAELELGRRLSAAGLLPTRTHERMRNIIGDPLDPGSQALCDELDLALRSVPSLGGLPGRFMLTAGHSVSGLGCDIGVAGDVLLLAGQDSGVRVSDPVAAVVAAALAFQKARGAAWRLSEVDFGVAKVTAAVVATAPGAATSAERYTPAVTPVVPGPVPGRDLVVAGVPLGRLDARLLPGTAVRVTPWRALVLPSSADTTGLITDPDSPLWGVGSCAGSPGCAKSLADVRTDAVAWARTRTDRGPAHWSGCARRCGRPAGEVREFVATGGGYEEIG
ncbi:MULTISPECIES: hypothetical protein [Actinosynnema]|uniref:hypothetical protein n=1 Tax=Actinosynnema TaxID=40566 RepID=UPI0020A410C9|nr:hypothetical protein [Actinosynnema pretiosum]MCP2095766.1 precorrin-3B synthase [Actinosynnema pretiosum]